MLKLTKHERYNILIEEFNKCVDKNLDIYDEQLKERLQGKSPKTIQRYFEEFMNEHNSIVEVGGRRRKTYKMIEPTDLFVETLEHFDGIGWLLTEAQEKDPKIFDRLEAYTKESNKEFLFKNRPSEDTKSIEAKEIFKHLKSAVEHREYRKITFSAGVVQDNLKCLKLIYMENNWYLAYVAYDDKVRFARISFIEKVEYASNVGKYHPSSVVEQLEFLKNIQNSMTLYGKPKKIATLKVDQKKARYFKEGMKPILSSQKFVEKLEDGSIIFTLEYTQSMEILPLIQSWMPNLIILEPEELKEQYIKKLQKTIKTHQ